MSESARLSHSFSQGRIVLYKRKRSRFWQAQLKYAPSKYKRISTKTDDLGEAQEFAEDQLHELKWRIKHNKPADSRGFRDVAKIAAKQLTCPLKTVPVFKLFSNLSTGTVLRGQVSNSNTARGVFVVIIQ
jgi:hypothetical protein